MPAPEWGTVSSIIDGTLNLDPLGYLDQWLPKELLAENCGPTLWFLKESSEYSSVTTTSAERYDDLGTQDGSPLVAHYDDRLSENASSISPVSPRC